MDKLSFLNKNDTTWPATQVGPRPVKACLGGNEAGVFGVDKGSRTRRSSYENGDERPYQKVSPSVILRESRMIMSVEIETERTVHHCGICEDDNNLNFVFS